MLDNYLWVNIDVTTYIPAPKSTQSTHLYFELSIKEQNFSEPN